MLARPPVHFAALLVAAAACGGSTAARIDAGASRDGGATEGGQSPPPGGGGGAVGSNPKQVTCRDETCSVPGQYCCLPTRGNGSAPGCRPDTFSACGGQRLSCDERADCAANEVCCAEGGELTGGDEQTLVTACLPSCITGAPRWQVCKSDAECESGACRAYDCGGRTPSLRFCSKPDGCGEAR